MALEHERREKPAIAPLTDRYEPERVRNITDPLQLYKQEIEQYPLLTSAQIQTLVTIRDTASSLEERDQAVIALTTGNLRLVLPIANRYYSRGLSFLDKVQEGNVGLMEAAEKYDPTRETQFSTFATLRISSAIRRAIHNTSRAIRLPVHAEVFIAQTGKINSRLEQILEREPTITEIARFFDIPEDKISYVQRIAQPISSLNKKVVEGATEEIGDIIEDTGSELGEEVEIISEVDAFLSILSVDEKRIICASFGIGTMAKTHAEIAEALGKSRSRIGQILADSLQKIRDFTNQDVTLPVSPAN